VVSGLGHRTVPYGLIGRSADVGYVTPHDRDQAATILAEIRAAQAAAGRADEPVPVLADLVVFLGPDAAAAQARRDRLDEVAGREYTSDAQIFAGTASQLADLMLDWRTGGLAGFRLRPAVIPDDLEAITRDLVPELQRRGVFRTAYEASTLRGLLGFDRPANRYAAGPAGRAAAGRN
jgi:alkanesulfonate monooxygenase SsuD/methylene tetrahydromethanopterin reductase-like flavin-dependent oxidoreductase (luciferase family)